jgi:anion-transporting  ArsA/GET3 family ATPase
VKLPGTSEDARGVAHLVEDMKVLVCVGSGGVGKTTSAAMLALYGACIGKRTLVITIDPARRLANSLGLDELLHEPRPLDRSVLEAAGLSPEASVDAMMLDLQAAWDDMVRRISVDEDTAEHILSNRFYGYLSRDLPGGQEFIACEALLTVAKERGYDLVVLDTPPTQNALDFLDAPQRIVRFLDLETFKRFTERGSSAAARLGLRFLDGATGAAQTVLSKFTGTELLDELGEFLYLLRSLYAPLIERTRQFEEMLRGPGTRFLVVTSPSPGPLQEARFFRELLDERELGVGGLVVNRVLPHPGSDVAALDTEGIAAALTELGVAPEALEAAASDVERALHEQTALADRAQRDIDELVAAAAGDAPVVLVPQLAQDVHDARALAELLPWLVGDDIRTHRS